MAKVLFVICVPSEKNTKIAETINGNKDKDSNKSDTTKDAGEDCIICFNLFVFLLYRYGGGMASMLTSQLGGHVFGFCIKMVLNN